MKALEAVVNVTNPNAKLNAKLAKVTGELNG
jgi:hypothetical protein